jgi:aspartyl-tRNA(Asn)/glutamyl-tRNA(Gln) amidotransferase subunit C
MSVTREEVAKIAALARIKVDEAELDRMVPEFNNILAWVEQLGEVDTSAGVEPMTAVIPSRRCACATTWSTPTR